MIEKLGRGSEILQRGLEPMREGVSHTKRAKIIAKSAHSIKQSLMNILIKYSRNEIFGIVRSKSICFAEF